MCPTHTFNWGALGYAPTQAPTWSCLHTDPALVGSRVLRLSLLVYGLFSRGGLGEDLGGDGQGLPVTDLALGPAAPTPASCGHYGRCRPTGISR